MEVRNASSMRFVGTMLANAFEAGAMWAMQVDRGLIMAAQVPSMMEPSGIGETMGKTSIHELPKDIL